MTGVSVCQKDTVKKSRSRLLIQADGVITVGKVELPFDIRGCIDEPRAGCPWSCD
jgi:hypothetical protein